jgi:hypothetical protein
VNWIHAPVNDSRPEARIGGGDVPVPKVDPKDPDTVYVANVVTWKSTDAGKTWYGLRGAPGGDDYQNVFVNPNNTKIIALASDQGMIISQNGGETWTQWFNQATAQVYHVTADNAFPYRVWGGQQDSGSACVDSRSNDGRITFHDWHPAGIEEYGYAAPDPPIRTSSMAARSRVTTGVPARFRTWSRSRCAATVFCGHSPCSFLLPIPTSSTSPRTRCG